MTGRTQMATKTKRTQDEILADVRATWINRPTGRLGIALWSGASIAEAPTQTKKEFPALPEATRTRYARPGQPAGRGLVRLVSPRQVNYIKSLMSQRDTANLVRLPGSEDIENMSLAGARDLIDRLLECPIKGSAQHSTQEMATEAQIKYLNSLIAQKGADSIEGFTPTKREASEIINRLKTLPNAPRPAITTTGSVAEDGMYVKDGVVYKVQKAVNGSGYLYAKKLNAETGEFEYAGRGPLHKLTPADKMTREQAGEYGKLYGRCMRCSRTLTDEYSIANGYGKICAEKF